jgi:hypothetical protein
MSASASGGSSTPVPGGQGGELFKGFSALGNRVRFSFLHIYISFIISRCTDEHNIDLNSLQIV